MKPRPHSQSMRTVVDATAAAAHTKRAHAQLTSLCTTYFEQIQNPIKGKNTHGELEVRFLTGRLTKTDYDNVIKKLKSSAPRFQHTSSSPGANNLNSDGRNYTLKISPEIINPRTGRPQIDNLRVEIRGLDAIQQYCQSGDNLALPSIQRDISAVRKRKVGDVADFSDFQFRVAYSIEEQMPPAVLAKIAAEWGGVKKVYRLVYRDSFAWRPSSSSTTSTSTSSSPSPMQVDISIVRSSTKNSAGYMIPVYKVSDSGVFRAPQTFEIEIEANPLNAFIYNANASKLASDILIVAKSVMSGLQGSNFPIPQSEQTRVLNSYWNVIQSTHPNATQTQPNATQTQPNATQPAPPRIPFIGPSQRTLQLEHISYHANAPTMATATAMAMSNADSLEEGEIREMPIIMPVDPPALVRESGINGIHVTDPGQWCVSEKADGERRLMFIDETGRIYFISMQMNVTFTGACTHITDIFRSIFDGELIFRDKVGEFINRFAAFDVYFYGGLNVRRMPFISANSRERTRHVIVQTVFMPRNFKSAITATTTATTATATTTAPQSRPALSHPIPITLTYKRFYFDRELTPDGFYGVCSKVLDKDYPYHTDGLIIQSTRWGVGGNAEGVEGAMKKLTWNGSFKWKPPEMNTIDFLVRTQKNAQQKDEITPMVQFGVDMTQSSQHRQYKTLRLHVGYDPAIHGAIHTCDNLLNEQYNEGLDQPQGQTQGQGQGQGQTLGKSQYIATPFAPNNPYDELASYCHIVLASDDVGMPQMKAEDGDVFTDETVVEFRYDMDATNPYMRWVPIRVRYDKTADYRQGRRSFGNDYTTANSNWSSIHNPVTEHMLRTGENIPPQAAVESETDVYYNSSGHSGVATSRLRKFHNLYVKSRLIVGACKPGETILDFACGKAGDLQKWIDARAKFVLGLDASNDCLENHLDGACTRYLHTRHKFQNANANYRGGSHRQGLPDALFIHADSSRNIRSGAGATTSRGTSILQALFGANPTDPSVLQFPAISRHRGVGRDGFHVTSCQFAMHYMCQSDATFYSFLRNVSECTRQDGYFIATYYDGQSVYNLLRSLEMGGIYAVYAKPGDTRPIWSVTKQYNNTALDVNPGVDNNADNNNNNADNNNNNADNNANLFPDDKTSLGMKIDVFQDSINQTISEYLVSQIFLITEMEKYGFQLISNEEALSMKLPAGSGMFGDLYNSMNASIVAASSGRGAGTGPGATASAASPKELALYKLMRMTKPEQEISFLNRYSIFKKVHKTDAVELTRNIAPAANALSVNAPPALSVNAPPALSVNAPPALSVNASQLEANEANNVNVNAETIRLEGAELSSDIIDEQPDQLDQPDQPNQAEHDQSYVLDPNAIANGTNANNTEGDAITKKHKTKRTKDPTEPKERKTKEPKEPKEPKERKTKEPKTMEPATINTVDAGVVAAEAKIKKPKTSTRKKQPDVAAAPTPAPAPTPTDTIVSAVQSKPKKQSTRKAKISQPPPSSPSL